MSTQSLTPVVSTASTTATFMVLRQDQESRAYRWLGLLSRTDGDFRFRYTADVASDPGLPTLPGFPDRTREYESPQLFATFANRVMTPRRDSYQSFLSMIGLSGGDADPFEVLARTWGTRATDRIQVLPVPTLDDAGHLQMRFLVHGGRYVDPEAQVLGTVDAGDRLRLAREPENQYDDLAILVCKDDSESVRPVGYVPAPLAPFVHSLWDQGIDPEVTAEAVNMPDSPLASNQMRLLARLEAAAGSGFDVMAALNPERLVLGPDDIRKSHSHSRILGRNQA